MLHKLLGLPLNASAQGGAIDELNGWVHLLMLVLFVGWGLFFAYILFRFRSGKHPKADHDGVQSHASSYLEAGIAVIEIILLVALSIPFWSKKVSAFPTDPKTQHMRVIGQQFRWVVHYPGLDGKFGAADSKLITDDNPIGLNRKSPGGKDDVELVGQLYVPVNCPVILEIATTDVIHSFWMPYLRVKQDTIPGMRIPIYFTATSTSDELRAVQAFTSPLPGKINWGQGLYAATQDYKGKDGKVVAYKDGLTPGGDRLPLSDTSVKKLIADGITEVHAAPLYPVEIACAQLCGINHFKMKGFVNILTDEEFKKWYADAVEEAKSSE